MPVPGLNSLTHNHNFPPKTRVLKFPNILDLSGYNADKSAVSESTLILEIKLKCRGQKFKNCAALNKNFGLKPVGGE